MKLPQPGSGDAGPHESELISEELLGRLFFYFDKNIVRREEDRKVSEQEINYRGGFETFSREWKFNFDKRKKKFCRLHIEFDKQQQQQDRLK